VHAAHDALDDVLGPDLEGFEPGKGLGVEVQRGVDVVVAGRVGGGAGVWSVWLGGHRRPECTGEISAWFVGVFGVFWVLG